MSGDAGSAGEDSCASAFASALPETARKDWRSRRVSVAKVDTRKERCTSLRRFQLFSKGRWSDKWLATQAAGTRLRSTRQKQHVKLSTKLEKERLMPPRMSIESIADGLNVPERLLLFCLASGTDWQKGGITHATAQHMMICGLIDRDGAAFCQRTRSSHRAPSDRLS
jgi:hypothetical protein